jgi:hypothetical protein
MTEEARGPVMIAATTMLRPPPARISKVSETIVLPRSVSVKSLIGGLVGSLIGFVIYFLGVVFVIGFNLEGFIITVGGFTGVGVLIVNYSPLKGENWATWLTLQTGAARGGKVRIDGQPVRAYIGIAPLPFSAAGTVTIGSGAQEVLAGSVDDRGASLPPEQVRRNSLRRAQAEQGF